MRVSERIVPGKQTELDFRGSNTEHYPDSELGKESPIESNTETLYMKKNHLFLLNQIFHCTLHEKKLYNSTSSVIALLLNQIQLMKAVLNHPKTSYLKTVVKCLENALLNPLTIENLVKSVSF